MTAHRRATAGVTLVEILIAVTLLSLLTLAMLMVMRVGLMAYSKTQDKLMDNRRVAGAQRVLQDELMGLVPVSPPCMSMGPGSNQNFVFLQGEPQKMRIVSTYSLQEAWRGHAQILEFIVIPGADGAGVRLIVNEIPFSLATAGAMCVGTAPDPELGVTVPLFPPIETGPKSFILADQLAYCKFSYFAGSVKPEEPLAWHDTGTGRGWPKAIRVEMAPYEPNPGRLQPITVIAPYEIHRRLGYLYEDK